MLRFSPKRFQLIKLLRSQYGIDRRAGTQSRVHQCVESRRVIFCRNADSRLVARRVQKEPIGRSLGFTKFLADFLDLLLIVLVYPHDLADLFVGQLELVDVAKHHVFIAFMRPQSAFLQAFQ